MPRAPRAIADIMNFSGTAAALIAQIREQSNLLALVKRELDASLCVHLVAALLLNRQLVIYADSSAWASRLRFSSRTLRGRLLCKGLRVDKITVRITLPTGIKRNSNQLERHLSRENSKLIEQTAATIDDPGLRQALKRLSRHGR